MISEFGGQEMDVVVAYEFVVSSCASNEIQIDILMQIDDHDKVYVDIVHSQKGSRSCLAGQVGCECRVDRLEIPHRKGGSS